MIKFSVQSIDPNVRKLYQYETVPQYVDGMGAGYGQPVYSNPVYGSPPLGQPMYPQQQQPNYYGKWIHQVYLLILYRYLVLCLDLIWVYVRVIKLICYEISIYSLKMGQAFQKFINYARTLTSIYNMDVKWGDTRPMKGL